MFCCGISDQFEGPLSQRLADSFGSPALSDEWLVSGGETSMAGLVIPTKIRTDGFLGGLPLRTNSAVFFLLTPLRSH